MFEKLHRDHLELHEIGRDIRSRIRSETLTDPVGLAQCRWRLARTVTQHLAMEDAHVYARLAADLRPGVAAAGAEIGGKAGALLTAFNAHIVQWPAEAVARDWQGYRKAIIALLDRLDARTAFEESRLFPLLSDSRRKAA